MNAFIFIIVCLLIIFTPTIAISFLSFIWLVFCFGIIVIIAIIMSIVSFLAVTVLLLLEAAFTYVSKYKTKTKGEN